MMKTQLDNTQEEQSTIAQSVQKEPSTGGTATIVDNRPATIYQRKLRETMDSHRNSEKPLQRKANKTGLPDTLKSGIENLSGYGMDDVKVHYNSSKPAQLQAHAYAQGTDIHLASGQQKHLPHEAWHVVQQKQGRVKPTMQLKGKVNVNDDAGLEKEADVMGSRALSSEKSTTQLKTNQIHHTKQPIVQRKILIGEDKYTAATAAKASNLAEDQNFNPEELEATSNGILPVYDKVNKEFESMDVFMEALKKIKATYSNAWNIESLPLIGYITKQEEVQDTVKNDPKAYEYLLTTVGFEHEFAGMDESPLSGVSHLEFAITEKKMPFTGIPFILETDASDAIELVSPPFLMPTVRGIPLPDPKKIGIVDENMQKALYDALSESAKNTKLSIGEMLYNLSKKIGWKFNLKDNIEIKPDNLSKRTNIDKLVGDLEKGNTEKLILDTEKVGQYTVGKSKKIENYHGNKKEEYELEKYNTAPQVNFATDIATATLLEKATKSEVSESRIVKVYKKMEEVLMRHIKQPTTGSANIPVFYVQMIRKLAGLLSVHAQEDTQIHQDKCYANALKKANGEEINDEADVSNMFELTSWHSMVKDTTSVWVKDHIVNIAYGMLKAEDFPVIIKLLKDIDIATFAEDIGKPLQDLSIAYNNLAQRYIDYLEKIGKILHKYSDNKNAYRDYAKNKKNLPNDYDDLQRSSDKHLKEKEKYERLAASTEEFKSPFVKLLQTTIDNVISDLEKGEGKSKPNLRGEGMYGHDNTKGGARQDTYLDPKVVNSHKLWPQELLVAEIRRGDMKQQLEDARILSIMMEKIKQQTEDNKPLINEQLEPIIRRVYFKEGQKQETKDAL